MHDYPSAFLKRKPPPMTMPPPPPPPPRDSLVKKLQRRIARWQSGLMLVGGMLVALLAVFVYGLFQPAPQVITQGDIDAAVSRTMASATPKPALASTVYRIIHPSLVYIEAINNSDKEGMGVGSGVVIDDTGQILSSLHVVSKAEKIRVTFADGFESDAEIIAEIPEKDIVLLRPEVIPDTVVPAVLGDSGALQVGDEVVAVGNPFGIANSLSSGVVSGLNRNFRSPTTGATLNELIQFDAAVNPGNSGGPLLNRDGEVVGIVAALLNPTDQNFFIGIGFAVPINTAAAAGGPPDY